MTYRYTALSITAFLLAASPVRAQLNILTQFDPSNTAGTCGIAYNSVAGEVLVIQCFGATIDRYDETGTFLSSAPIAGESANDVDVDMSPVDLVMYGTAVQQGQLLFMNGETGAVDIYAIDEVTMAVIDTLQTGFGVSHVVGGSYHPARQTFFAVQDNVPGGFEANRVAEIDATTGDTIHTFSVQPEFFVDYGDLDISPISGNLFIVSSAESTIAEFTAEGAFVAEHVLPVGVSSLSGIALDNDLQGAWVCNTSGEVFKLGNFPVGGAEHARPTALSLFPNPTLDVLTITGQVPTGNRRIGIMDVTGRMVLSASLTTSPARIDVSSLAPGRYLVTFDGGGPGLPFLKD